MASSRLTDWLLEWRYSLLLVLILAGVFVAGSWRSAHSPPPQDIGSYYEQGLAAYQAGDFARAVEVLGKAYALDNADVGVNTLLGWSHWRQGRVPQARFHFERALEHDRDSLDAQTGLGFASLAQGDLDTAVPLLERASQASPLDRDIALNLGSAYVRAGLNRKAAGVYRSMLGHDPNDAAARREFLGIYGLPEFEDDFPLDLPRAERPAVQEQWFRAQGNYLQVREGAQWRDVYLVGTNLGPARPGEFPSTVSREHRVYAEWLREMAAMNANSVRVYTILPPAFYRALADHNRASAAPIWLIQEVWINDEAQDLYDPKIEEEFSRDLQRIIDLLHGRGDVPYRPGAQFGLYTADVSRWVIGLAVGREIEPHLAQRTNARHPSTTGHPGRYVRLIRGTPTEAWFARMCDRAVAYELSVYNAQRPLTVVNWPPLDPLSHPTEASFAEEVAIRQARGEPVSMDTFELPDFGNDTDVVSLDITKFRTGQEFTGGLFALYHVYQHWPDFLFREPAFAQARDAQGPNRYLGYLQALKKAHTGVPLLIGEYGLATTVGVAHLHPDGWHNGGFTEASQAALLERFTQNHYDVGAAGSIVFAWKDEWWKKVADHYTGDFEIPRERDPLWFNVLDPEEAFGVIGYEPDAPVPLLRGNPQDWSGAQSLGPASGEGPVRGVQAMTDYAYLYLRVDVGPGFDWTQRHLWLALNSLPGEAGSRALPDLPLRLEAGANFLLQIEGPPSARLLVADNYSPNTHQALPGTALEQHMVRKSGLSVGLTEQSPFVEIRTEANQRRFARDGTFYPALEFSRSPLRHGTADRSSPAFSDHAMWHWDPARGMIEVRLPWALLLVTDPSSRRVFAGTDANAVPLARVSPGVSVAALVVTASVPREVVASVPAANGRELSAAPPTFTWATWEEVQARPVEKRAYFTLKALFARLGRGPS